MTDNHSIIFDSTNADVAVIMGSQSDYHIMQYASQQLADFNIAYEEWIISAHRTPERMVSFCHQAAERGLKLIIAGAGGAAHLPGMCASHTNIPVIGVPITSKFQDGMDSLLSIIQMPRGIPVATMAVGQAGAVNAAVMAGKILALQDENIALNMQKYQQQLTNDVALKPTISPSS